MIATELKVRLYGDPVLKRRSSLVANVGAAERIFIQSMIATMHAHKGIGLAAPQVGISQRIIVADTGDGQGPIALINPKILKRYGSGYMEEGCLSIPGIIVNIRRSQEIIVHYIDVHNKEIEQTFSDLMARVIQHETDHLDGKLIIDYASILQRKKFKDQLRKIQQEQAKNNHT